MYYCCRICVVVVLIAVVFRCHGWLLCVVSCCWLLVVWLVVVVDVCCVFVVCGWLLLCAVWRCLWCLVVCWCLMVCAFCCAVAVCCVLSVVVC